MFIPETAKYYPVQSNFTDVGFFNLSNEKILWDFLKSHNLITPISSIVAK